MERQYSDSLAKRSLNWGSVKLRALHRKGWKKNPKGITVKILFRPEEGFNELKIKKRKKVGVKRTHGEMPQVDVYCENIFEFCP